MTEVVVAVFCFAVGVFASAIGREVGALVERRRVLRDARRYRAMRADIRSAIDRGRR